MRVYVPPTAPRNAAYLLCWPFNQHYRKDSLPVAKGGFFRLSLQGQFWTDLASFDFRHFAVVMTSRISEVKWRGKEKEKKRRKRKKKNFQKSLI